MSIVPLFAAVLALMFVALSLYVISFRRDTKAIRIQANFAEYVPIALILLWFVEAVVYSLVLSAALNYAL